VSGSNTLDEAGTFTVDAGVLTTITPSKTRTFDTCVTAGDMLLVRETTSGLAGTEKGSSSLSRR
jgi:hypothetical protein